MSHKYEAVSSYDDELDQEDALLDQLEKEQGDGQRYVQLFFGDD